MAYYFNKEKKYYEVSFYVKVNGKRKQVHRRGFATVKAAKEFEREYLNKYNNSTEMTFQSLYELYIEYCSKRIKGGTLELKKIIFNNHILPYYSNMQIKEITTLIISNWQSKMLEKGLSNEYLRQCNTQLKIILNYADKYFDVTNSMKKNDPICSSEEKKMKIWTVEEFNIFYNSLKKEDYKAIFLTAFWTGARIGEILALTLNDIDFENNYINIDKTLYRNKINTPKTKSSIRKIKISDTVKNQLRKYSDSLPNLKKNDKLFYKGYTVIAAFLKREIKKLGLKFATMHDFRHSHASLLIGNGVSIVAVSKRLGHKNTSMTLNTYSHLLKDDELNLIKKIESLE